MFLMHTYQQKNKNKKQQQQQRKNVTSSNFCLADPSEWLHAAGNEENATFKSSQYSFDVNEQSSKEEYKP